MKKEVEMEVMSFEEVRKAVKSSGASGYVDGSRFWIWTQACIKKEGWTYLDDDGLEVPLKFVGYKYYVTDDIAGDCISDARESAEACITGFQTLKEAYDYVISEI